MSVLAGLTVNYFRGLSSGLTLRWLEQVWQQYHGSVALSLYVAFATLAIVLAVGVPAGYALARSKSRAARAIEEALVLPVALPGLASALALLVVYGGFTAFRMSLWFIVVGHVVFTLPFMVRAVAAVAAGADLRTLEEGAASLGASFVTRFVTIVLPNLRPGIVAGALAVLTLSIGEFNLTWMLHTPDTKTLPVGLRRHVCVAAPRSRQRVHDPVPADDAAAARRDAVARRRSVRHAGTQEAPALNFSQT